MMMKKKRKKTKRKKNCLHILLLQTTVTVHITALYSHTFSLYIPKSSSCYQCDSAVKYFTVTALKQVKYITISHPSARHDGI
jgi:hypothetical protein